MHLARLIDGLTVDGQPARLVGAAAAVSSVDVRAVREDSRKVEPGDVFVAVRGLKVDGHDFAAAAIERGAAAIVVERELPVAVPQIVVASAARALGILIARTLGSPADKLTLIGLTGTNGKTTSTYLLESILVAAGARPGVIGTVSYRWGGTTIDAPYTTPTPETLQRALADMVAAGCTHAVMEVTSAALLMDRVAGLSFQVAAFTNLTQDHLDLHGSMEAYRDAKRRLFSTYLAPGGAAVVNVDDPEGAGMGAAARPGARVLQVSIQRPADIAVAACESSVAGIRATVQTPTGPIELASRPLVGQYNVANLALAVGVAEALGIPHDAIARGIETLRGVPGRVERVANDAGLDIVVDYAHTPDALENVLATLRPLTTRRLICVFGCGGDRDPTKRPKMGAAVARLADLAVVTSDNPRTEDPQSILDMILPAVPKPFFVDVDRRTAIRAAIAEAVPGDIVLIAGKGHEDYQILGTTKIHFDDREEAAAAIAARPRWTASEIAWVTGGTAHGDAAFTRITIDGRAAAPGDLYVAIRGETHDGHAFVDQALAAGASGALVASGRASAGVSIEVDDTRVALGLLGREQRRRWARDVAESRLVAVTGSAGKTTTKDLIRAALAAAATTHAARGSLNNETGVPLTLLGLRPFHRFAVIEMGMRGLRQIQYLTQLAEPDVAVVVNAGTAHIELLGSTDAIAQAKGEIYLGLKNGGTAIVPADDERLAGWAKKHAPRARVLTFGEAAGADVRLSGYRPVTDVVGGGTRGLGSELTLEVLGQSRTLRLALIGRHSAVDASCALAAAIAAGVDADTALRGLARATPPAMRGEVVEIGGRRVIVDCYNANPASMAAALRTLAELAHGHRGVAVVGDMLELGDQSEAEHAAVGRLAAELGLPVVALGAWKDTVARATGQPALAWTTDEPRAAARQALAATEPGDWILVKASRGMRLERVIDAMREDAV
jgi:MurE/MurF fusion protein